MYIFDEIMKEVFWYSLGFASYVDKEIPELQGSGVLIQYNGYQGIITAAHVARQLERLDNISVVYSEDRIGYTFKRDLFAIDIIAHEEGARYGPDLALVTPPPPLLTELKSKKSFMNLQRIPSFVSNAQDGHIHQWCLCGTAAELSAHEGELHNYRIAFMTFLCSEPNFAVHSGYDLFEAEVDYNEPTDIPQSFGGLSGAGLWFIEVRRIKETEGFEICRHPRLAGIAFYQTDIINRKRIIRGHGIKSLYQLTVECIRNKSK